MTINNIFTVESSENGIRLDKWFQKRFPFIARNHLYKLLRTGQVRVEKRRIKSNFRITTGQQIRVPPSLENIILKPQLIKGNSFPNKSLESYSLQNKILKMNSHIIAIDKPAGLAVQGGTQQKIHLDGMLDSLQFDFEERPRLVHRLDKDTSGVLLIARTASSAKALTEAFKNKAIQKKYWAIVVGSPKQNSGVIDASLAKIRGRWGEKVALDHVKGKSAETSFRVLQNINDIVTLLELKPVTGRTHQLRVHCTIFGYPILGDGKYGGRGAFLKEIDHPKQLHLYSREIKLFHPKIGDFSCQAPIPAHFTKTFSFLGIQPSEIKI